MSNSNKKYEDMAEHTKNNRPEKETKKWMPQQSPPENGF